MSLRPGFAPPLRSARPLTSARVARLLAAAWGRGRLAWGVSVASLIGGVLTLVVFRRSVPHVGWIVGYLVVLWLVATVLAQGRAWFDRRGGRHVLRAGDYTVQTLYHGLLLFVLPGYFASTTFDGITAPFFLLLAAAALLTTIDPWYQAIVSQRPRIGRSFGAFSLFAALNVALPLVGVAPARAVVSSAVLTALALLPLTIAPGRPRWPAARGALLVLVAAGPVGWLLTPVVPPAPLHLVSPRLAHAVVGLEPEAPVGPRVSAATLRTGVGLVAYTPVSAPPRLRQPIAHRWRHEGRLVTTVVLPTPVLGGRVAGFRTFSRKVDFPADPRGRWSVDVITASGQLIGRLRFTVGS